ncbi:MAG: integrase arm-type DNA-binding domain-containing protein [Rhodocyclaceae bacterium]|nr:integrase arm-type DNA-binding domain-containing protein [Rhodocyclaceae bacterium]
MPLTDTALRAARPGPKPQKLFDGGGLYVEVAPSGGKWWRLKYRFGGKEKRISLGVYPDVSLKQARARRDKARRLLADRIDPGERRKAEKSAMVELAANSFDAVVQEWTEKFRPKWTPGYHAKVVRRLQVNVLPWLGALPIHSITAPQVLSCARRAESRGAIDVAHRIVQDCGQVFRYAIATGRAERDPSVELRGALTPLVVKHHAAITDPKAVGELLRAIHGYQGTFAVGCALRLAPLLFVRPGELRAAEWPEFDFEAAEWRIPASRMKMRDAHIVPLSRQAVAILCELQPLTGRGRFVFPGARTNGRPMSENTVNAALRRLGFGSDQHTGHGFRSMASTLLNEQGWNRDAIERQLAHAERDGVRAAYNRAEHLPERRRMMQAWADYLDDLRTKERP